MFGYRKIKFYSCTSNFAFVNFKPATHSFDAWEFDYRNSAKKITCLKKCGWLILVPFKEHTFQLVTEACHFFSGSWHLCAARSEEFLYKITQTETNDFIWSFIKNKNKIPSHAEAGYKLCHSSQARVEKCGWWTECWDLVSGWLVLVEFRGFWNLL